MSNLTLRLALLAPDLAEQVAVHLAQPARALRVVAATDLTLPAKLALLHVLNRSGELVSRSEIQAVDLIVDAHLDEALHELVRCRWLLTIPTGEPPCLATTFRLARDHHQQAVLQGAVR